MKTQRQQMLDVINMVSKGLADRDLVRELCNVWFDGSKVFASKESGLGVQVAFTTEFQGGVDGKLLAALLSNGGSAEVDIEMLEDGLRVKQGRSNAKLAHRLLDESLYPYHSIKLDGGSEVTKLPLGSSEFQEVLRFLLLGVPDQRSSSLAQPVLYVERTAAKELCFLGTDNNSVAVSKWPVTDFFINVGKSFGISREFIVTALAVFKGCSESAALVVGPKTVRAVTVAPDISMAVIAPVVTLPEGVSWWSRIQGILPTAPVVPVPNFTKALARLSAVSSEQNTECVLELKDGILALSMTGGAGLVRERFRLEDHKKNITGHFNLSTFSRAFAQGGFESIRVTERVILLEGKRGQFLLALNPSQ